MSSKKIILFLILILNINNVSASLNYTERWTYPITSMVSNPADNMDYYFDGAATVWTLVSDCGNRQYILYNGSVKSINLVWSASTNGTNETVNASFRLNGYNYPISSISNTDGYKWFYNESMNVSVNKSDYFCIHIKTPNWSTNPVNTVVSGVVNFEYNNSLNISINNNYYNISLNNSNLFKSIIISDLTNIKYLNQYNYSIFINDTYYKDIQLNEILLYPDNENITIYIKNNINTNIDDTYNIGKIYLTLGIMYFLGFGILILIIVIIGRKIIKR